jgi:protein-S-isoprenylcysteine O-methyltransferase
MCGSTFAKPEAPHRRNDVIGSLDGCGSSQEVLVRPLFFENTVYAVVFTVAILIWVLPEWVGSVTQRSQAGAARRDRGSKLVLTITVDAGVWGGVLLAYGLPSAAIPGDRPLVFGIGIALMLLGVGLRWYAIWVLGRFFTRDVAVRAGQTVIRTGPYRFVRHPAYSGLLLTLLGLGLTLGNAASVVAILAGAGVGFAYRVRVEEQALCEALGQPYLDYMRQTRRFIPFVF